jgi:ABC-type oligopeptide transport system ATPase subunit
VSMLDAQVRKHFLDILLDFQREHGMTTLFITHDLSTVYYLGGEVMVITKGSIVERGPVSKVMHEPSHPYTQLLLDSIPQPDPDDRWTGRIAVDELDRLDDTTPADTPAPEAPIL